MIFNAAIFRFVRWNNCDYSIHRARQIMLGVLDGTMRLYENFNHNGLLAVHLIEEVYYAC